MSSTFAPHETATGEKPELVLRSPAFKALATFLVLGSISGFLGLYEVFSYINDAHHFDEFTIILMLFSSVGFFSIVVGNVVTRRTLLVSPKGFVYVVGKKAEFCRWEEIVSIDRYLIRNKEYDLPRATYWIHDEHGRTFKLHDFRLDHTDCFCEWFLIPRVRERLLDKALADFDAGREVGFGPISVSEHGMRYKGSLLPWEDLAEVESDLAGDLVVRKRGKLFSWCEPSAKAVPNLFVLLELLEMRLRSRVVVKNTIMDWWNQLPQPHWHRDFGDAERPGVVERPWHRS